VEASVEVGRGTRSGRGVFFSCTRIRKVQKQQRYWPMDFVH
jgi:hypothetical protein